VKCGLSSAHAAEGETPSCYHNLDQRLARRFIDAILAASRLIISNVFEKVNAARSTGMSGCLLRPSCGGSTCPLSNC